jgi:hypothetical protein
VTAATATPTSFTLDHDGARLELRARREGLRTHVALLRDGEAVGEATRLGAVLLPLDGGPGGPADGPLTAPTALVLTVLPGTVSRALLLVPRPSADPTEDPTGGPTDETGGRSDGDRRPGPPAEFVDALPKPLARFATAVRREFAPPPGSVAARLAAFRLAHPRLWASRHVVLAAAKVGLALLGVAAFLRLLVQPLLDRLLGLLRPFFDWLRGLLPDIDLPEIPWPDIPWPAIDLPDLHAPGWLLVLLGTAKFWAPILVAIGAAVVEVRRRRRAAARRGGHDGEDAEDRGANG